MTCPCSSPGVRCCRFTTDTLTCCVCCKTAMRIHTERKAMLECKRCGKRPYGWTIERDQEGMPVRLLWGSK